MSLGSLGSLNVLLSADTAQFSSAMDKAAHSAERNLRKIGISANLGLAALSAAFIANTKNALTFADSVGDMADRLGVTSRQMSVLTYAAKMSDVEIGSLESTIKKMYISAYKGNEVFKTLGVAVKDSNGVFRNGYDIFNDVVDALRKMPDGVGKANAAVEAFGKSGQDIIPLFKNGATSIKDFGDEAKKLGAIIDEQSASNADRFDKFVKRAVEAAKGFGVKTVDGIASVIDGFKLVYQSSEDYQKSLDDYRKKIDATTTADKNKSQAIIEQSMAYEKAAEQAERLNKMTEDGEKLTESMRTAQEKYNDELEFYNTLLQGGAITQETFSRAAKKSMDDLSEQTKKTNKLNDAARDLGFSFASAFEDSIIEGKKFQEVLLSLAKDIERIILRKAITEPLANAIGGFFAPSTPKKGVAVTTASKHGNVFQAFANGGVINGPMTFPMTGGKRGLAGEAGKEAILPLTRTASGDLGVKTSGANKTIVNVYAPPGSTVQQDTQQDGGMEKISIYIDKAVAGNINKPGSDTHRAMKNTFGVGQVLTKR